MPRSGGVLLATLLATVVAAGSAHADRIKNPTAVFAGLDKITGRIISFEVGINETVQFGSLQLTPRICFSRPNYETPNTNTFVEVDEIGTNNDFKRIFTGWMFASSPGLNAVEHPVYDFWLTDCKGGTEIIKVAPEKEDIPEVTPFENKRPTGPVPAVERKDKRQQPTQTFYPTNVMPAPPPPSGGGGGGRPLSIVPVGPDPARGN